MEELKLTDLKIQQKTTEDLIGELVKESYLRSIALVNMSMSDRIFALLMQLIASNEYLRELDISWSEVR